MKGSVSSLGLTYAEVKETLLPSDISIDDDENKNFIPISELTSAFNQDLALNVAPNHQKMLVSKYGNKHGDIDVLRLLKDAGVAEARGESSVPLAADVARRRMHKESVQEEWASRVGSPERGAAATTVGARGSMDQVELIKSSKQNVEALRDLHGVLLAEAEKAGEGDETSTVKVSLKTPPPVAISPLMEYVRSSQQEAKAEAAAVPTMPRDNAANATTNPTPPSPAPIGVDPPSANHLQSRGVRAEPKSELRPAAPGSPETKAVAAAAALPQQLSDSRMSRLERENTMLKAEMSFLDKDFFEELEDLKHRYVRLQEIVGEAPARDMSAGIPVHGREAAEAPYPMSKSVEQGKKGMPLDRLSWSVRQSMTAMDRAGITSQLAGTRLTTRAASPYTYAPAGNQSGARAQEAGQTLGSVSSATSGKASSRGGNGWGDVRRSVDSDIAHGGGAPSQRLATLTHPNGEATRVGGSHGLGAGVHSTTASVRDEHGVGSFSNLCERRLVFELSNAVNPSQAARSLISRIVDVSRGRSKNPGYISVPQLSDVITSVGLHMARQEVEVLASGFGGDGRGGINAEEFCDVVQTLIYDYLGEHSLADAKRRADAGDGRSARRQEDQVDNLLLEMCESILVHDKKAVIGTSDSMFTSLVGPFKDCDTRGSGVLPFNDFCQACKDLGVMLTHQDLASIARRFAAKGDKADAALPSSHLDHIDSFRNKVLEGSLKGKADKDPRFGDWLSSSGIGFEQSGLDSDLLVEYKPFVSKLVDQLEVLMRKKGGLPLAASTAPWTLKEFDLVDTLISQLEMMKPSERRRCLMSLQYALSAADMRQDGDLDGFSVLNALLSSGFKLQRLNRVRMLRSIEELGGKLEYGELCLVLLRSCADWKSEERSVVTKILKAMGMTVIERRGWCARLRQSLAHAASEYQKKAGSMNHKEASNVDGIPPSSFLYCLRECGVTLNIEEEATVLDCLDTERLAELSQAAAKTDKDSGSKKVIENGDNYGVPLIYYKNFITFCSRFCGDWTDSAPEVVISLRSAVQTIATPLVALQEFSSLIKSFDEMDSGTISGRAFQISCHRSRLMANFPESDVSKLVDILVIDGGGGGRLRYSPFLLYLRGFCSAINQQSAAPGIVEQLLNSATDSQGTLLPLRNWIIRNVEGVVFKKFGAYVDDGSTDITQKSYLLNRRSLNGLLREFSIIYRPEDIDLLQIQVSNLSDTPTGVDSSANKDVVVDSKNLFRLLLQTRGAWTMLHPDLCDKLRKVMTVLGTETFSATSATSASADGGTAGNLAMGFSSSKRGIESVTARKILARVRAFADVAPVAVSSNDDTMPISEGRMVEKDIFASVLRASGVPINDEDLLVLCDATDIHPAARRVRCDVIIEALSGARPMESVRGAAASVSRAANMSEAAAYAVDHLKDMLWGVCRRLKRSSNEWIADVRAVFKGFDSGSSGYISTEDFALSLSLLNTPISLELLRDIPMVPDGPGLVSYREILDLVLVAPKSRAGISVDDAKKSYRSKSKDPRGDGDESAAREETGKKGAEEKKKFKMDSTYHSNSAVRALHNVVRKSLRSFIVQDDTLEEAWVALLKAFRRFDPGESNSVSPRDFCLAVSVLIDGDDVVMTKEEWISVIDFYTISPASRPKAKAQQTTVDYMKFCEQCLDPTELGQVKFKDVEVLGKVAARVDNKGREGVSGTSVSLASRPSAMGSSQRMESVRTQGSKSREGHLYSRADGSRGGDRGAVDHDNDTENDDRRHNSKAESFGRSGAAGKGAGFKGAQALKAFYESLSKEQSSVLSSLRHDVHEKLSALVAKAKGTHKSPYDLLQERLQSEDRNKGGSVSRQALFAALQNLGVKPHDYFSSSSVKKDLADKMEKIAADGKSVDISGFLAIVFEK